MLRLALFCAAFALCAGPASAQAQQLHLTGEAHYVQAHPRIAQVCPGCRKKAPASARISLARDDGYGEYPLREGSGNTFTVVIGGQSWEVNSGAAAVRLGPGGDVLHVNAGGRARAGGEGSPRMSIQLHATLPVAGQVPSGVHGARLLSFITGRVGASVAALAFDTCRGHPPGDFMRDAEGCRAGSASLHFSSASRGAEAAAPAAAPAAPSLVVFVGGWGDATVGGGIVRGMEARFEARMRQSAPGARIRTAYYEWSGQAEIEREILAFRRAHPGGAVALVGHSMGGHTAYETARALGGRAPIQLLVTLDPVTRGGDRPTTEYPGQRERPRSPVPATPRPPNVGRWINVWPSAEGSLVSGNLCLRVLAYSGRWRQRRDADHDATRGTDHCAADEMFNQDSCVQESLRAMLRGGHVAGPCRSAGAVDRPVDGGAERIAKAGVSRPGAERVHAPPGAPRLSPRGGMGVPQ
jgi:pimeloyl-ACP methyl ester carboxylesterase